MPPGTVEQLHLDLKGASAPSHHLAERITSELAFAEGLIGLHPRKGAAWRKLISKAAETVTAAVAGGKVGGLPKAVAAAEEVLAPIARVAKTYTVHCVGHAHIDMNWMWSWPETVAVTNDTFLTVLRLMEEFPDFCFSQSQASVYAIVRDYCPDLLEPIRRRVREGRWEVTAVHWVEGDKNLACGEALARHMLYTRRFLADLLDLKPQDVPLDWECDMFGHAHTIPTVLVRGGATRYYMCRSGMPVKPPVFRWQGPDGSRVLVVRDITGYNGTLDPAVAMSLLEFCRQTGLRDWMDVYGVGDHGGGPTRRDILRCHDMDSWPVFPRFRLAATRGFYDLLEKHADDWPVIDGEINFEFAGCYTSQTMIKKANRFGENYCLQAESAAALAHSAVGRQYPAAALRDAWTDVLFGQFHDILPGSGVHWTREYQVGQFQKVAAATGMVRTHSYRALAAAVDTSFAQAQLPALPAEQESIALGAGAGRGTMEGGLSAASHLVDGPRPFVVFNPTAWARSEVVQATVWDADTGQAAGDLRAKRFVARFPDGRVIPAQKVATGNYWGHRFAEVVFPVTVESLGYASVAIEEGSADAPAGAVRTYEVPPRHEPHAPTAPAMENDLLAVEFDPATGGVARLLDKTTGRDLAVKTDPLGTLEYVLERSRGMSAWVIAAAQSRQTNLPVRSLSVGQNGPYLATVVAKLKVASSDVTVTYALKAGQPWLEITVEAVWVERGGPDVGVPHLRMRFPLDLEEAKARYEIPFGSIERDLNAGQEVPALRWADVVGRNGNSPAGCAVLNDSKYGHSLTGSTLGVTLIRSSYEPDPLPEIGEHSIRLAVAPHGKVLPPADLVRLGAAFNLPLAVVGTDAHAGRLPPAASAVAVLAPGGVVLSSLKKAEDDDALVLRLYDLGGKAATAKVALDALLLGEPVEAAEVDLLERPVAPSAAKVTPGGFSVNVPGFGIASVKVRLKR